MPAWFWAVNLWSLPFHYSFFFPGHAGVKIQELNVENHDWVLEIGNREYSICYFRIPLYTLLWSLVVKEIGSWELRRLIKNPGWPRLRCYNWAFTGWNCWAGCWKWTRSLKWNGSIGRNGTCVKKIWSACLKGIDFILSHADRSSQLRIKRTRVQWWDRWVTGVYRYFQNGSVIFKIWNDRGVRSFCRVPVIDITELRAYSSPSRAAACLFGV